MRQLWLARHAKAEPGKGSIADADRSLSARGIAEAKLAGAFLRQQDVVFDLVCCSPAKRTVQTLNLLDPKLSESGQIAFVESIYAAGQGQIEELIAGFDDSDANVLIVGHNPSMYDTAMWLVGDRPHGLAAGFPTASIAGFAIAVANWAAVSYGDGELLTFKTP